MHAPPLRSPPASRVSRAAAARTTLALLVLSAILSPASAAPRTRALADLSIEELLNESITSVSKRETPLGEAPSAITVLAAEDILSHGITSLPEALRLVPGLDVARIGASQWAISSRGFNDQYANKLLVLLDGRSVYTPAFGGVFWDAQDIVLDDLDRIEVIRGPGATLWGANAVTGVINITTKPAKDTQGGRITLNAGSENRLSATVRHGGALSPTAHYRVYVKRFERAGLEDAAGARTPDAWDAWRAGFRTDWQASARDLLTLQGDYYLQHTGEQVDLPQLTAPLSRRFIVENLNRGGNVLARWTRTFSDASHLSVQSYADHFQHWAGLTRERRDTGDLELEFRQPFAGRHDVIVGAGYRFTTDRFNTTPSLAWMPAHRDLRLFTAFLQDEIALVPHRLHATLGTKVEHNDFTGWETQPGLRLLWLPTPRQTVWASASRAVSTPNRFLRDARFTTGAFQQSPFAPVFATVLIGNPAAASETQKAFEAGYRFEAYRQLYVDVTAYYNLFDRLRDVRSGAPQFQSPPPHMVLPLYFQTTGAGETYGAEFAVHWKPVPNLHLYASYSRLEVRIPGDPGSSPRHQASARMRLAVSKRIELNAAAFHVDRITLGFAPFTTVIPAYLRLDAGLTWAASSRFTLGLWGQNLLDPRHPEFTSVTNFQNAEVPRTFAARASWRF